MNFTVLASILRILSGHSTMAQLQLRDEHGGEHRIEVPVEYARTLQPGALVVLSWSVHTMPDLAIPPAPGAEDAASSTTASAATPLNTTGTSAASRPIAPLSATAPPVTSSSPPVTAASAPARVTTIAGEIQTSAPHEPDSMAAARRWIEGLFHHAK